MWSYLIIRILLWAFGIVAALFPTLHTVGTGVLTWPPTKSAALINQAGVFRDLIFILVVVSLLEISAVVDFIFTHRTSADRMFSASIILLLINIAALGSGLAGFMSLPDHGVISDDWLRTVEALLILGVGLGFATEIVISGANHRMRE